MTTLWLMQAMLTVAEIVGVFWGIGWILREKTEGVRRWFLELGIGLLAALTVFQRTCIMYSRWWLVITILFCGVLDLACYRDKRGLIWTFQALYFETLYCLDLFFYIGLKIFSGERDYQMDQLVIGPERIFIFLVSRVVVICGLSILYQKRGKAVQYLKSGGNVWILVIVCQHISLFACDSVFLQGMETISILGWKLMLLSYPLLILVLLFFLLQKRYKSLYAQSEGKNALYMEQLKGMEREKKEKAKLYHDFKNHMIAVQGMIADGENLKAAEYLRELLEKEEKQESRLGISVLDYLIQVKVSDARSQNVEVQERYEGGFPELDTEKLSDWCVLLGNLWDNALEGCMRTEGARRIAFSVRCIEKAITVKMENSCIPDLDMKRLATTKPDSDMHGIGLQNMEYVVDKYEGKMKRECKNGVFLTQITVVM